MAATETMHRVKYTQDQVTRLRSDAKNENGKEVHDALAGDLWVWEDLISRANHLFGRIMELDQETQGLILKKKIEFDAELDSAIGELLREWYDFGAEILPRLEGLERDCGSVNRADVFRGHLSEVKSMLTPDGEFFGGDGLAGLRDQAIEEHLAGQTEPIHVKGCAE